jgi:UDP-N-acetylglucosamine transferase subunit ALG13
VIFATVGTQLPFPRLIDAVAAHAAETGEAVVAQTCAPADPARWPGIEQHATVDPATFERLFRAARIVVSHAGIGSYLSARRFARPLVMLPRRHALGEHRNDHQMATARALDGRTGLFIAWEAENLGSLLRGTVSDSATPAGSAAGSAELKRLIARLRNEIGE